MAYRRAALAMQGAPYFMYFVELTLLAIVPFFAQKSEIFANFGYFVAIFAVFGTLFTGQNSAVVHKN